MRPWTATHLIFFLWAATPRLPAEGQEAVSGVAFPRGNPFDPLIADPKQPRLLAAYAHVRLPTRGMTVGAASVGDDVGIFRWGRAGRDGLQVGLSGGIFAQFDLGTSSNDLVNTDYVIGVPVTYRRGRLSARTGFYHQSSHLGDEYVLREPTTRINLSFEAAVLLVAGDFGPWRLYGGGEYLVRHEPYDLRNGVWHAGVEYRRPRDSFGLGSMGRGFPVLAVDVRSWQQHGWAPGISVNAGIEFRPAGVLPEWSGRTWSVLGFLYRGPSPYGQFYSERVRYLGAALQLGF